jgi:hypothetical protein
MNAIIVYEISPSEREVEVKAQMTNLGYYVRWSSNEKIFNLPKQTIWKQNIELKAALIEFQGIVTRLNSIPNTSMITIERCIVLSVNPWDGLVGNPL